MLGAFVEGGVRLLQALDFAGLEGGLDLGHEAGDGFAGGCIDSIAELIEGGTDSGEHFASLEAGLGKDPFAHVVEGVLDARCDHFLDGFIGDIDGALDPDDFFDAGFYVARENVEDAVGVDLELDADAGLGLRGGIEGEVEAAEFQLSRAISRSP